MQATSSTDHTNSPSTALSEDIATLSGELSTLSEGLSSKEREEETEQEHAPVKADRKLGGEWNDWDGRSNESSNSRKRLFISLLMCFVISLGGLGLFTWYLITPRLAEWHPLLPTLFLSVTILLLGLSFITLLFFVATILVGRYLPKKLSRWILNFIGKIEGGVFLMGGWFKVNRDRLAHSFVQIHNRLIRLQTEAVAPERILVLLPRCLTREQLQATQALCSEMGVKVAIVPGGELARKRIMEHRPKAIIGVACERDLLSGIRDVRGKVHVLGIPNTRPNGPCKNTEIDLVALKEAIEYLLHPEPVSNYALKQSNLSAH